MEGIYTKKINEESTRPSVSNTNSGKVQVYLFVQRKEKPLNHFTCSNVNQSDDRCSAEETTPLKKTTKDHCSLPPDFSLVLLFASVLIIH